MTTLTTGTWTLDPTHTEIGFTVRHLMSKVRGKFGAFEGTVVTGETFEGSTVSVEVDLSSIDTGTAQRDDHLRSSDFFDVETSPKMTFVTTGVTAKGDDTFTLSGDLTIKGITRPIDLDVEYLGEGSDPWGGTRFGIEAKGEISRKDFGITFNIPVAGSDRAVIGDVVTLVLQAEAVLQQQEALQS